MPSINNDVEFAGPIILWSYSKNCDYSLNYSSNFWPLSHYFLPFFSTLHGTVTTDWTIVFGQFSDVFGRCDIYNYWLDYSSDTSYVVPSENVRKVSEKRPNYSFNQWKFDTMDWQCSPKIDLDVNSRDQRFLEILYERIASSNSPKFDIWVFIKKHFNKISLNIYEYK